jgi:Tfp pilus assembly protein PilX
MADSARIRKGLRSRISHQLRSESGIALPAAVIMLFVITSLAAAIASGAVTASNQSNRDRNVKFAVAAADAGIEAATYRINKLVPGQTQCVIESAGNLTLTAVSGDGWCPAQTEDLGDGASYSYRVSPAAQVTVSGERLLQRKIVSTGAVRGVTRRASTVVGSSTGRALFSGYAVISLNDINMPNTTLIDGNAGTNGNVGLTQSAVVCGSITYGRGKQFTTANQAHQCTNFLLQEGPQPLVLNPVDQPLATDNSRFGTLDPWTNPSKIDWNPTTRVLKIGQSGTLTLTGNVYKFCYLEVSNTGQLIVASRDNSRPPLTIYMDTPENCPGVANAGSINFANNTAITNNNTDPTKLQLYVAGSPSVATFVYFNNSFSSGLPLTLYAPQSTVMLQNGTFIIGAVAAKQVSLQNSSHILWDNRVNNITIDSVQPLYRRQSYVECTPTPTGSEPDSGC